MPRKVKPGPAILKIEGLSDGREIRPKTYVDDFTGQAMPVVQDMKPVRAMKSAQEVKDEINRAKRKQLDKILQATKPQAKQVELIPKGWRKIGELGGKAMLVPMPPWRRM